MKVKMKYIVWGLAMAFNFNLLTAQTGDSYFVSLTRIGWFYNPSSIANAKEVMQDNEFDRNEAGLISNIFANPLLLNGQLLDYGKFDLSTTGILTVVRGNPEKPEATPIPFYVYIRRNGVLVEGKKTPLSDKVIYKLDLKEIFLGCKPGDLLIIKPAKAEDWRAKRILKLIGGC